MGATISKELVGEIDDHVQSVTPERRAQTLSRVIRLFCLDADRYSDSQIDVFDDVFIALIGQESDPKALSQASVLLAELSTAPPKTIRMLAFHRDDAVASPVLTKSGRLTDHDLVRIALEGDRARMVAIAGRKTISKLVSDALVSRKDVAVLAALGQNPAACLNLPSRDAIGSPKLDLPKGGEDALLKGPTAPPKDYTQVQIEITELNRTGRLGNSSVNKFAVRQQYTHVIAALAALSDAEIERIEPLMESHRLEGLLTACKSARLDWTTARMIIRNRPDCAPLAKEELERCEQFYEGLLLSLAQRTTRFAEMT